MKKQNKILTMRYIKTFEQYSLDEPIVNEEILGFSKEEKEKKAQAAAAGKAEASTKKYDAELAKGAEAAAKSLGVDVETYKNSAIKYISEFDSNPIFRGSNPDCIWDVSSKTFKRIPTDEWPLEKATHVYKFGNFATGKAAYKDARGRSHPALPSAEEKAKEFGVDVETYKNALINYMQKEKTAPQFSNMEFNKEKKTFTRKAGLAASRTFT